MYYQFQVTYLGNGSGGESEADTVTMDMFDALDSASSTGNFTEILQGSFGASVASSSSVKICEGSVCTGTVTPGEALYATAPFSMPSTNGAFSWDFTITALFGAGSPVNSYIHFTFPPAALPTVGGVVSASAFGEFKIFAPGSWIEIYGTNLSLGTRGWAASDFNGINGPTSLSGTRVTIGGESAFVDYVSPLQVNVQVPGGLSPGAQQLIVSAAGGQSAPFAVLLNSTEPGLLAPTNFNIDGTQYVVAQFADGTYVAPPAAIAGVTSHAAQPGDEIVIYGIGFGTVSPNILPGQLVGQSNTLAAPFTISFGGTQATSVPYDGLAPNFMGLYQLNVVVPNVAASSTVPLTFTLGETAGAQALAIAVGN